MLDGYNLRSHSLLYIHRHEWTSISFEGSFIGCCRICYLPLCYFLCTKTLLLPLTSNSAPSCCRRRGMEFLLIPTSCHISATWQSHLCRNFRFQFEDSLICHGNSVILLLLRWRRNKRSSVEEDGGDSAHYDVGRLAHSIKVMASAANSASQ